MGSKKDSSWRDSIPDLSVALPFLAGNSRFKQWLRNFAAWITAFDKGGKITAKAYELNPNAENPFIAIAELSHLNVVGEGSLPSGPLVVVANHPTGCMDGISYGKWLLEQRLDTLILTTDALVPIPSFKNHVIGLSLYGGEQSARRNAKSLRRAMQHLNQGGCIAAFPAGTISWMQDDGVVRDGAWMLSVFEIALRCRVPVACLRIDAHHQRTMEYFLSLHPLVRTFLLGRTFTAACNTTHRLILRGVIPAEAYDDAARLAAAARQLVDPL